MGQGSGRKPFLRLWGWTNPAAEIAVLPEVLLEAALADVQGLGLGGGAGVVEKA